MHTAGLEAFDRTLQHTHTWLRDLMEEMRTEERHHAWYVLSNVLHAVRDRLPPEEAAHLAAQLPMLVRGMYFDGWRPSAVPARHPSMLEVLEARFRDEWHDDPRFYVRAVVRVLARHVSPGEIEDVRRALPDDVRDLWEEALAS